MKDPCPYCGEPLQGYGREGAWDAFRKPKGYGHCMGCMVLWDDKGIWLGGHGNGKGGWKPLPEGVLLIGDERRA